MPTTVSSHYYPSRKGWLLWLIVLVLAYLGVGNIYRALVASNMSMIVINVAIWVPLLVFILTIFFGTGYTIKESTLVVKVGPVTMATVTISEMWSAERTHTLLSAPANSLKRLRIKYKGGEVVISPDREEEFLNTLKAINPNIQVGV